MDDLLVKVTSEQETLLRVIHGGLVALDYQEWPTWQYIEGTLRRKRLDARDLLYSLPMVGRDAFLATNYSSVWVDRRNLQSGSTVRLTAAAALQCEEFRQSGDWFASALRYLVDKFKHAPLSPAKPLQVIVSNQELRTVCSLPDEFLRILPEMLRVEPFGLADMHGSDNKGTWHIKLREPLVEYEDIGDLRGYVARVVELITARSIKPERVLFSTAKAANVLSRPRSRSASRSNLSYVDLDVLDQLRALDHPDWNLVKLIALLDELNDNFERRNQYACHALLRAILDHVSPIFGFRDFKVLANNHRWTSQIIKAYMRQLEDFKTQGHDALHSQVKASKDLLSMNDVPPPVRLNALLSELLAQLNIDRAIM